MRSAEVIARLVTAYDPPRYAAFPEMAVDTGDAPQRIDLWVADLWPSSQYARMAFEVKVSRSDFLDEIRNPAKRRAAVLLSNLFYFAVPAGLVQPDEVPIDTGLAWVHATEQPMREPDDPAPAIGQEPTPWLTFPLEAPWRDTPPPTWRFTAALTRRVVEQDSRKLAVLREATRIARRELDETRRACAAADAERAFLASQVEEFRRERAADRALPDRS